MHLQLPAARQVRHRPRGIQGVDDDCTRSTRPAPMMCEGKRVPAISNHAEITCHPVTIAQPEIW